MAQYREHPTNEFDGAPNPVILLEPAVLNGYLAQPVPTINSPWDGPGILELYSSVFNIVLKIHSSVFIVLKTIMYVFIVLVEPARRRCGAWGSAPSMCL